MTYEQVKKLQKVFEAKAPTTQYLYFLPCITIEEVEHSGVILYENTSKNALPIAHFNIQGLSKDNTYSVHLSIKDEEFIFKSSVNFCEEVIERFIKNQIKKY